mgnify:CR=1 FL=1
MTLKLALATRPSFIPLTALNGAYTKEICNTMINCGIEVSYSSIPQLYSLDGFGILLGTWITQLGLSSGAYYLMSRSDEQLWQPILQFSPSE